MTATQCLKRKRIGNEFEDIPHRYTIMIIYLLGATKEQEWNTANLLRCLQKKESLCELHTHLLGMGNASFWVDTILTDRRILPTQKDFMKKSEINLRRDLGPLIWNDNTQEFIDPVQVIEFFDDLTSNDSASPKYKDIKPFCDLMSEEYEKEKNHHQLTYRKNFSYDVVFSLDNIVKGLGLKQDQPKDMLQCLVEEKLGIYTKNDWNDHTFFKNWIIFNAREQKLEITYGMQATALRMLIGGRTPIDKLTDSAQRDARAYIINAFSMMNADGTEPRSVDFHTFRGAFTPEFYPRRFALKDSLYAQRLDLLAYLLKHVLDRYSACLPPVKYCEFSMGCNDLIRPWILDLLSTFCVREELCGSFKSLVGRNYFPWLKVSDPKPKVDYRFLAGFSRQIQRTNDCSTSDEAIELLLEAPHCVIHELFKEFYLTDHKKPTLLFSKHVQQLRKMKEQREKNPKFLDLVVGLDAFGDELGHPYCPFVAHEFIDFVTDARKQNRSFGVRIHAAENVPFIRPDLSGYRLFAAHMYILYRCIDFLKKKLKTNIRVGHGIAFDKLLSIENYKYRKSSVLVAEMQRNVESVFSEIPFEVNITSNFYLLGDALRNVKEHRPLSNLYAKKVPVVLSTDNDGIWPIDKCGLGHYAHHSLAAEYCRAIATSFISKEEHLDRMIEISFNSRFFQNKSVAKVHCEKADNSSDNKNDYYSSTDIIVHPALLDMVLHSQSNDVDCSSFLRHYRNIHKKQDAKHPAKDYDKIMMRLVVAFFYLIRSRPYEEFKQDYEYLFRTPSEIKYRYRELFSQTGCPKIYEICKKVHWYLMTDTPDKVVQMEVTVDKEHFLFCSAVSNKSRVRLDFLLNAIKELINKNTENLIVFCFLPSLDKSDEEIIEDLQDIDKLIRDPNTAVNKVYLYTNTKKDIVFPCLKSGKVFINSKPNMRMDAMEENIDSVLIYPVCPHSSVVASSIDFIAKHIHKTDFSIEPHYVSFRYLVIPFLPLRFGCPVGPNNENPQTHFLKHFHLTETNFAKEVVVESHFVCEQLYDPKYNILCANIKYGKEIETDDLLKSIEKYKFDFLQILKTLCQSMKNFSLRPSYFVKLKDINEYDSYKKDFGNKSNKIPLPIMQIDKEFLICSSVSVFHPHNEKWSRILWSLATSWNPPFSSAKNPHEYPCSKWVLEILAIDREKLNKEFEEATWEEFLGDVLLNEDEHAWYFDTVSHWCDIIEKVFYEEKNLNAFVEFLKKSGQSEKLLKTLKNEGRHKLGNQWQLDVIEKRQAKEFLNKLIEKMGLPRIYNS